MDIRIRLAIGSFAMLLWLASCTSCVERAPADGKSAGESCATHADCLAGLRCLNDVCAHANSDGGSLDVVGQDLAGNDLATVADHTAADVTVAVDRAGHDAVAPHDAATPHDAASPSDAMAGLDVDVSQCNPTLSPTSTDLGQVFVGAIASLSAGVVNTGSGPCLITGVDVSPANTALGVLEPASGVIRVDPIFSGGSVATVRLVYAPTATGSLNALVRVLMPGVSGGGLQLTVTATAVAAPVDACVSFAGNLLDFGTLPVNCQGSHEVLVVNRCRDVQRVASLSLVGNPVFSLVTSTPFDVAAGSTAAVVLNGLSDSGGMATSRLTGLLESGAAVAGAVELVLDIGGSVVDRYVQGGAEPVDLFIVVDDSGSMDAAQAQLAGDLSALVDEFETLDVDYRIGVSTTDMDSGGVAGRFIPLTETSPVISSASSPDPTTRLVAAVTPGINGSGTEQGFGATLAALSLPLVAGRNTGLLRADALLAVLYLSNEDDQSAAEVIDTLRFLRGLKAHLGANAISVGAIVSFADDVCTSATDPGTRYLELVDQAGGVSASICATDWKPLLRELVRLGAGRRATFFLSSAAPATPEVRVDGAARTAGVDFTYDAQPGTVTFEPGHLPQPGQVVTLSYQSTCP